MARWAFDTLGIEVTKDKKLIKKAYSTLVKEYHPEDHPDEWEKIHNAYQAAMEYAQMPEDEEPAEEILTEDEYGEMFADAHAKWQEEESEKALALAKRLDELVQTPLALAGKEWQRFFAMEFLPGAGADELMVLFEAIYGNEIPLVAAELIVKTMIKRKEFYQASMEFNKAALADEIVNCIYQKIPGIEIPVKPIKKKKGIKGILKELLLGAGVGVVLLIVLALVLAGEGSKKTEVKKMAVQQLNEKYGEDLYSGEDLEIEEDVRHGSSGAQMIFYRVTEKETYDLIAYMLSRESGEEELLCFDKLQTLDIRQALEKDVNEKTGRPEGKLYWNSDGGDGGYIENGYFHEKYEGNIGEFLKREGKVREKMAETDFSAANTFSAKNGKADYYVPDREIKSVKQRLDRKEITEDEEFLAALGQCAADYETEFRGIMLPGTLFEEKMKQAGGDEESISVKENIIFSALEPPMPFSMMTGWYVCLPPEGQRYLKVENGMYSAKIIDMAKGIFGVETQISGKEGMLEEPGALDMADCMEETRTPDMPEIHKKVTQTAVSFCLKDGYETKQAYCLAIDKEIYNLPDSGYQVILTTYSDGREESEELPVSSYSTPRVNTEYGDVLEGEGYIFVRYPQTGEGEKAPVLTILGR